MDSAARARPPVFVSILNWNGAALTIRCLRSVLGSENPDFDIRVWLIENGSSDEDVAMLLEGIATMPVEIVRLARNVGFAAGHNLVIEKALACGAEWIWLLNNDSVVHPGTLARLVTLMRNEPRCAAVSPVIYSLQDRSIMDFCGAWHDWQRLVTLRPNRIDEARQLQQSTPRELWVHGTAPLLRVSALRDVGLFDESYFAYFEDDDLGVRLARAGWMSRVCYEAEILHARRVQQHTERPAYFFYLMARNSFAFWVRYAPRSGRLPLRVRLLCRQLIEASQLRRRGCDDKTAACLLGTAHGLSGRLGPPQMQGSPPLWLSLMSRVPHRLLKWFT